MSFLTPLYLLGGLAIALPIVFHLVRRSAKERRVFSSLMFLRPTPPRMTRRNRLEHWFLLLLRCLVIGALAFGFARPFFPASTSAAPPTPSGGRTAILVDTSASMRRDGVWPDALARVTALLEQAAAQQVALYAFDHGARALLSFEEWAALAPGERVATAAARLQGLQPSWKATHLGSALIRVADDLEEADQRAAPSGAKRLIVVTDLQEGSRLEGLQGHDWPRGLEVAIEMVRGRGRSNAGLQWLADADDSGQAPGDLVLRLRVSNASDAQREQFQLRWEGAPVASAAEVYVPPGQNRTLAAPKTPEGMSAGRLVLSGDDEPFDNTLYLVPPRTEEVTVWFLGDDPEKDPAQLLYYLQRAFPPTRRQKVAVRAVPPATPLESLAATLIPPDASSRPAAPRRPFTSTNRLVVVSSPLPPDRVPVVRGYAEAGGTVLVVMNDAGAAASLAQLANRPTLPAAEAASRRYALLGAMDFEHPLLAPFSDPRYNDFTKIRFWQHRRLDLDSWPEARVIARFDDDAPALFETPLGRGRLVVFAFSWRPAQSQFALSSKFVPLLGSLLDLAFGPSAAPGQYRVGEPVDLAALGAPGGPGGRAVRGPDGREWTLASGDPQFTHTDQPGFYELRTGSETIPWGVNLDPHESRTAPLPVEELARLGVPMKAETAAAPLAPALARQLQAAEWEARQKPWRWLLLAALVVLVGETWLAGWLTRRAQARLEAA